MSNTLSTEELRQKFGEISLEIITQKNSHRASCIRRVSDNVALAYSTIIFNKTGIEAFGQEFHDQILNGAKIGEVIKNSGIQHERLVTDKNLAHVNFGLAFIFNTMGKLCISRNVEYKTNGERYALITEFYNPEAIEVNLDLNISNIKSSIYDENWYLIDQLKPGYKTQYLRLAHGFLKKSMHVGIEDEDEFVKSTMGTLELLMKDENTKLFVATSKDEFIGYVAINIHPALHINGLECMIRELYVQEEHQRSGVGSALINFVEMYAIKRGCGRLSLATKWDDDKQRGFYESVGFSRRCDFVTKKLLG